MACRTIRRESGAQRSGPAGPSLAQAADEELIRLAQSGSEEAFEALFRRHWGYACRVARKWNRNPADCEDIAQVALTRLFKHIGRFRVGSRLRTLLYRVVRNASLDMDRHRRAVAEGECGFPECRPHWARDPARNHLAAEMEHAAWQQLFCLPPRARAAFVLHQLEHRGFEEVARVLGCSVTSAWRYCHEATTVLRRRAAERRRELTV